MTTEATQVTGSLTAPEGARPGDVLAERYELLEVLDADGASVGYRAIDQETERSVLVRVLAGPGLREHRMAEVLERLRSVVGVGGRFLSVLVDADREGRHPFTVEAFPPGTPLSAIFQARRERDEPLGPREVLPVLARIHAALRAIPEPWHHGDVRAERVWVDTDGVRLTGAFLLAALPPPLLAERIEALGPAALAYAPEMAAGKSGPPADRWGLAAIAWEALTSRGPDLDADPGALSPPLHAALRELLDPDPARRPADVAALIEAVAERAGLAVPHLDPEPRRSPRPRRIEGAAVEGTQEVSFDQILEERTLRVDADELEQDEDALDADLVEAALSPDDTARHAPVTDLRATIDDALDPRLVRAALDVTVDESTSVDGLDPRLVRAALGVTSDEHSFEELGSDELALEPTGPSMVAEATPISTRPAPSRPAPSNAPPARPAPSNAPPTRPASNNAAPSNAPPTRPAPSNAPPSNAAPTRPAPSNAPPSNAPATHAPTARASDRAPRGAASSTPPAPRAPARSPLPPKPRPERVGASGEGGGTAVVQRPIEPPHPTRPRPRPWLGPLIVVGALLLAIAIVGLGFAVRSWMSDEQTSEERSRHIEERLREIRDNP